MSFSLNEEQRAALQPEVQRELEQREWAEPGDNVMAEYVTVLLANGNSRERVHTEMDDLVGSDFRPSFLDWLFDAAQHLVSGPVRNRNDSPPPRESRERDRDVRERSPAPAPARSRRLLDSALGGLGQESSKRKAYDNGDQLPKRRISDGPVTAPGAPRAMLGMEGKGLAERMGPRQNGARGGMAVRGMGRGTGMGGGFAGGFRGNGMVGNSNGMMNQSQGFGRFFNPGQQEMMAQMMMMQANMAQMGEMMHQMVEEKEMAQSSAPPARTAPVKVPHGTKLGGHSVSAITPKPSAAPGPIPEKPSSKALCRYSIGCSNARCPYSHPSPVADEQSGMVLSEEPCEDGKKCKDAECTKSHVSPAAVLAGPSRLLCKYQNCSNPACAFRHEDANGNPIPPPALTAAKAAKDAASARSASAAAAVAGNPSSDNEDGDFEVVMSSKGLMDGALEDKGGAEKGCRYGERCTRPDCKFSHPASRPAPKAKFGKPPFRSGSASGFGTGMNKSKKFGSAATASGGQSLNPAVGAFVPKSAGGEVAS